MISTTAGSIIKKVLMGGLAIATIAQFIIVGYFIAQEKWMLANQFLITALMLVMYLRILVDQK